MANIVTFTSKKPQAHKKGLHNGDLIVIRNRHYLVTSVNYPESAKVSSRHKSELCSIVNIKSGNRVFSSGVRRDIGTSDFVRRVNLILAAIRKNSPAYRDSHEYANITQQDIRVIARSSYDLVIEKLEK